MSDVLLRATRMSCIYRVLDCNFLSHFGTERSHYYFEWNFLCIWLVMQHSRKGLSETPAQTFTNTMSFSRKAEGWREHTAVRDCRGRGLWTAGTHVP